MAAKIKSGDLVKVIRGKSNLRGSIFREPDRVVIARPNDRHTVAFRNDGEVFGCLLRKADGVERIGRRS